MKINVLSLAFIISVSSTGTKAQVTNPCIICPDGINVDDYVPRADIGDITTCLEIVEGAMTFDSDSDMCAALKQGGEFACCPKRDCIVCPSVIEATSEGFESITCCPNAKEPTIEPSWTGPTPIPDAVSLEDALLGPNSVAQAVAPKIQEENEPSSGSWSVGKGALVVLGLSFALVSLPLLLEVVIGVLDLILRIIILVLITLMT